MEKWIQVVNRGIVIFEREREREDFTNRTWIIFHPLHSVSFSLLLIFNDGKYEWNEWKCGGVDIKYFISSRFSFNYCTRWISPSEMCKLKMMLTKRIIFFFLLPFHFAPGSLHRIKTRVCVCVCVFKLRRKMDYLSQISPLSRTMPVELKKWVSDVP